MSMSIRRITVYLLLCVASVKAQSEPQIDCSGKNFYCPTENTYLLCFDDNEKGTIATWTEGTLCPPGTISDNESDAFCGSDVVVDCGGKYFNCPTIESFILCDDLPNGSTGSISTVTQPCPSGTYCDHIYGDYECDSPIIPETEIPTGAPPSIEPPKGPPKEDPPRNPSIFFEELIETETPIDASSTPSTENISELSETENDFVCLAEGRYPIAGVGCKSYIHCQVKDVIFVQNVYSCDDSFVYSEERSRCVPADTYTCLDESSTVEAITTTVEDLPTPVEDTTTTVADLPTKVEDSPTAIEDLPTPVEDTTTVDYVPPTISEPPTTIDEKDAPQLPDYICSGPGLWAHPKDCNSYIHCYISDITSKYQYWQYQCSNELVFDAVLGKCTEDKTPCEDLIFKCTSFGIFSDPVAINKYYYCVNKPGGTYHKLHYTCPIGKVFNGIKACVEESLNAPIESFALNQYQASRRSLSIQDDDEDKVEEFYEGSDEIVADQIYLNFD